MTEREGVKSKGKAESEKTKITKEASEIPVAREITLEELGLSTRVVAVLDEAGLETAQAILDKLDQGDAELLSISGVGDKTLEEVRKRLAEKGLLSLKQKGVDSGQKPQVKAEEAKVKTVKTPPSPKPGKVTAAEKTGLADIKPAEEGTEQRISFIVRLTVDERGHPRRTEIEHAQSGKKATFLALNGQQLAAFIKGNIGLPVASEPSVPPEPPIVKAKEKIVPQVKLQPPLSGLIITDVEVFHPETPGATTLVFGSDEEFLMQVNFQLRGPEASSLATQEAPFEVQVFANEVTSGKSTVLATHKTSLENDVLDYEPQMQVSGLSPGLYRLFTLVVVQGKPNMVGHFEGPVIHIAKAQLAKSPVTFLGSTTF